MVPVRQERNFNSNRDTEQVLLEKHFEVHASLCPGSEGFRVNEDFFASLLERHRLAVESFTTAPDSGAFAAARQDGGSQPARIQRATLRT